MVCIYVLSSVSEGFGICITWYGVYRYVCVLSPVVSEEVWYVTYVDPEKVNVSTAVLTGRVVTATAAETCRAWVVYMTLGHGSINVCCSPLPAEGRLQQYPEQ